MIYLDSFTQGEIPEPLAYRYLSAEDTPLDLTGFTATCQIRVGSGTAVENEATVSNPATGEVTYDWESGDLDATGVLRVLFRVEDPDNVFYSVPLVGFVRPALVDTGS